MVSQYGIIICELAIISTLLSLCYSQDIRLLGGSGTYEGRVEVRVNDVWSTVCNETWDIQDANVTCRELGNRTATMFSTMYGEGQGPILFSNVRCTGDEQRLGDCPHDESTLDVCDHTQDAGVQCSFKHDDLRLVGGSTPNEGRVEINVNGQWGQVCAGLSWENEEADVVCKTVGYPNGASMSSPESFGNGTGSALHILLTCTGREVNVLGCMKTAFKSLACPSGAEDATVVCSLAPEVTEQLSTGAIAGIGVGFGLVIVMCCIFSLNCKCRPFWKKRELDDTDVYQCNTASNADSKNYSTTSNLKSESENRKDSMSDIDPNMFVFAPKIPPAGFGGPSADASGANGTLPNIEEAKEPNGVAPVSEMKDDHKDESEDYDDVSLTLGEGVGVHSEDDVYDDVSLTLGEGVEGVHDEDEKENVTIDMQGEVHFNKENDYLELIDYPIQNADVNEDESESVSIDQQAGDHESHDLVAFQAGAETVPNLVAYDTRL